MTRGPKILNALRLIMGMVGDGTDHCVIGNHDFKLSRWIRKPSKAREVSQTLFTEAGRNPIERSRHVSDLAVWVGAPRRLPPEPGGFMELRAEDAGWIVDNYCPANAL